MRDVWVGRGEAPVQRPEGHIGDRRRREKMDVDPPQTPTVQMVCFREHQRFGVRDFCRRRKTRHEPEDFSARMQLSACELANDEWMRRDLSVVEQRDEGRVTSAKVVDPN